MPQFTPHVPGAGYYAASTTPCPLSAPTSGTFSPRSFQFHLSNPRNCRSLRMQVNNISILALQLTILLHNINLCHIRTRQVITINLCPTLTLNLVLEILLKILIIDCFNFFIALYR